MATIPDPNAQPRVGLQPSMAVSRRTPGIVENAVSDLGANVFALAAQEKARIDDTKANDARVALQEQMLDLKAGADGFLNKREAAVANTPKDGKPFLLDYTERAKAKSDSIAEGLSGNALRKFQSTSKEALLGFQADLLRHSITQVDEFHKNGHNSLVKMNGLTAAADPLNLGRVQNLLQNSLEATDAEGARLGKGADDIKLDKAIVTGNHYTQVVDALLNQGKALDAEQLLKKNAGNELFPADTMLALGNRVHTVIKQQVASSASDSTMQQVTPRMFPSELDRAAAAMAQTEAGGGFTPQKGPDFRGLVKQFNGDVEKAWAARAGGAKAVALAEKEAAKSMDDYRKAREKDPLGVMAAPYPEVKNWMDLLPKETQNYVKKNRAAFAAGTAAPEPTLLDVKNLARNNVLKQYPGATADVIEAAQASAEAKWNDMRTAKTQGQERVLEDVRQRIEAGVFTSEHDLTAQERGVLQEKVGSVRSYLTGREAAVDKAAQTSPAAVDAFYRLKNDTEALREAPVADIMALAPSIGKANVDKLLSDRNTYLNNPDAARAVSVDNDMFNATVTKLGFDTSTGNKVELMKLKDRVDEAVNQSQAQLKRALTRDEKRDIVTSMALEFPKVNVPGGGWFGGDTVKKQRGYQVAEPKNIVIPEDAKKKIIEQAAALGVTIKTDEQWRGAYRALLLEAKK